MKRRLSLLRDSRGLSAPSSSPCSARSCSASSSARAQIGILYFANAGLRNAVEEGARAAGVFPRPADAVIRARMAQKRFGLKPQYLGTPVITTGQDGGADFVQITATYRVPLQFVFVKVKPVTLTKTRRVYIWV
jgi:hypothetical protein